MRRFAPLAAGAVLLAVPTVVAFFSGGYFTAPRVVAGAVVWTLVVVLALVGGQTMPLPRERGGWLALAGLAGLTLWTALSLSWAPLSEPASAAVQRLLLYLGTLLAAAGAFRDPRAAKLVVPALAGGGTLVIGYGLVGRLLPVTIAPFRSARAGNRLEQPITYWNAEGLVAAMALVLCVALAGDDSRPRWMRAVAAASCVPLGAGLFLSYSRGALAAAAIGLILLVTLAPFRPHLRSAVSGLVVAAVAAGVVAAFGGLSPFDGSAAARQRDGIVVLAVLGLVAVLAAWRQARVVAVQRDTTPLAGAHWLRWLAVAAVAMGLIGVVAGGLGERGRGKSSAAEGASRLTSFQSRRYEYWGVGVDAFGENPLRGVGAGGFRVVWLKERPIPNSVTEIHSLPLEAAVELGLPGLILLFVVVGGVAATGRQALGRGDPLAPAACAACTAWALHAAIDWDWQLPAATLPAVLLAGGLLGDR